VAIAHWCPKGSKEDLSYEEIQKRGAAAMAGMGQPSA
jgi:hypothetical protein